MAVYLVTGVMASGKSSVGELLARSFEKGVHLRGDAFRRMVVAGREDMSAQPSDEAMRQLNLRYDLGALAADRYAQAGFDVAYQDVMIGRVLPEVVARIKTRPLFVVVLCPDPDVVAQREAGRGKTGYGHGFTPHNMHQMLLQETPRVGLWLDTTELTPEQTVARILAETKAGNGRIE